MRRVFAVGFVGFLVVAMATPALAQTNFPDSDGDGIPDIPAGFDDLGDWDRRAGAATLAQYIDETDAFGDDFDFSDTGSSLTGPCGGIAISYDADGVLIDAALDVGGDDPPIDFFDDDALQSTGRQAFTKDNPYKVDSQGTVAYFGFTGSLSADIPISDPATSGDPFGDALAETPFFWHLWDFTVQGIALDDGGDDNPQAEARNAGLVEMNDLMPFEFSALLKAGGQIRDGTAGAPGTGSMICGGEGWAHIISETEPILTPPGILAIALFAAGWSGLLFLSRPAITW